jgi:hypothetical protein
MRRAARAQIELTGWLVQNLESFFDKIPARDEFGEQLVEVNARALDPTFLWADVYALRLFPDTLRTTPRALLPPGYDRITNDPLVHYAFGVWSRRELRASDTADEVLEMMRRHVIPDLFKAVSEGVARRRLRAVADELERRIPDRTFVHLATMPSGGDLVSAFVDVDSLARVARMIA